MIYSSQTVFCNGNSFESLSPPPLLRRASREPYWPSVSQETCTIWQNQRPPPFFLMQTFIKLEDLRKGLRDHLQVCGLFSCHCFFSFTVSLLLIYSTTTSTMLDSLPFAPQCNKPMSDYCGLTEWHISYITSREQKLLKETGTVKSYIF